MATRADEPMSSTNDGSDRTAEIKDDIERTRGDMTRTVTAIEERLSPAHLKEQVKSVKDAVIGEYHEAKDHVKEDVSRELREAKDKLTGEINHVRGAVREATVGRVEHMVHDARDTVTDAGSTIVDTIRANPIPAALVAVGLGWLFVSARGTSESSMRGRIAQAPRRMLAGGQRVAGNAMHGAADMAHEATGAVGHLAHDVGDRVGHLAHEVGDRVGHVAHDVGDAAMHFGHETRVRGGRVIRGAGRQMRRAEQTFEGALHDNPLVFGAVAIAVGAAIGLALPNTRREDEWMGEAKDRLIERAESAAGQAIHKVEEKVGQLTQGGEGDKSDKSDKGEGAKTQPKNGIAASYGSKAT